MKPRMVILALLLLLLTCPSGVLADTWGTHYAVEVTVSTLPDVNSYKFTYAVTNLDQGSGGYVGLDGFYVQVPDSATITITNITDPNGYAGGSWTHYLPGGNPGSGSSATLQSGYQWLEWWGLGPESVYPKDTTAIFSFDASGVSVGTNPAAITTYWSGGNYSSYSNELNELQGPTYVPLPGTLALLGPGLLGLAVFGRRKIFKK